MSRRGSDGLTQICVRYEHVPNASSHEVRVLNAIHEE